MAAERRTGAHLKKRITYAELTILLIWSLLPVYWLVVTSLKTNRAIHNDPRRFPLARVSTH